MDRFNEKELLIMQFSKKNMKWEDATTDVQWYKAEANACRIKYIGSETFYYKSWAEILIINNPKVVAFENSIVFLENIELSNIVQILQFDKWYKVFYSNGRTGTYSEKRISLVKDISAKGNVRQLLTYLSEIAKLTSVSEGKDFLEKQINSITVLENTFIAKFIEGKLDKIDDKQPIIYPFETNKSQMEAVKNALTSELSLIQGPPGTGKTQTILNIVANYVVRGKNVAVVSGSNEATKNVEEKLRKYGYGTINAVLGKAENVEQFFSKGEVVPAADRRGNLNDLLAEIKEITRRLNEGYQYRLDLAKIEQIIREFEVEKSINDAEYSVSAHTVPKSIEQMQFTSKKLLSLVGILDVLPKEKKCRHFSSQAKTLYCG